MPIRHAALHQASTRATRALGETIDNLILHRRQASLSQAVVAHALGVSRSALAAWEQRRVEPTYTQLCRWGAIVGLDISLRSFIGGDPLRDAGQLRLLERFGRLIGPGWTWQAEVPITTDPRDRRAFDAIIRAGPARAAVEGVVRLLDAQGQTRPIVAKQEAAGIGCVILVLADSRHNRMAVASAEPTLAPAFPIRPRPALTILRAGGVPDQNAFVFA